MKKYISMVLSITLLFSISIGSTFAMDMMSSDEGVEIILVPETPTISEETPVEQSPISPIEGEPSEVEMPITDPIEAPNDGDEMIHLPADGANKPSDDTIEQPVDSSSDGSDLNDNDPNSEDNQDLVEITKSVTDSAVEVELKDIEVTGVKGEAPLSDELTGEILELGGEPLKAESIDFTVKYKDGSDISNDGSISVECINGDGVIDSNKSIELGYNLVLVSFKDGKIINKYITEFDYDGSGKAEIYLTTSFYRYDLNDIDSSKYDYEINISFKGYSITSKLMTDMESQVYCNISSLEDLSIVSGSKNTLNPVFKVIADGSKSQSPKLTYLLDQNNSKKISLSDRFSIVKRDVIKNEGNIKDILSSGVISTNGGSDLIDIDNSNIKTMISEDGTKITADLTSIGLGSEEVFNLKDNYDKPLRLFFSLCWTNYYECFHNEHNIILTLTGNNGDVYQFDTTLSEVKLYNDTNQNGVVIIEKPKSYTYSVKIEFVDDNLCYNPDHKKKQFCYFDIVNKSLIDSSNYNDILIKGANREIQKNYETIGHSLNVYQESCIDSNLKLKYELASDNAYCTYILIDGKPYFTNGIYYDCSPSFNYKSIGLFKMDSRNLVFGSRDTGYFAIDDFSSSDLNFIRLTPWNEAFRGFRESRDESQQVPETRFDESNYEIYINIINKDGASVRGNLRDIDGLYIDKSQDIKTQIIVKDKASNLEYYLDTDISKGEINYDLSFLNNMKPTGNNLMKGMKYSFPYFIKSTDTFGNRVIKVRGSDGDNSYMNLEIIPKNEGEHSLVSLYSDSLFNNFHEDLAVGEYGANYYIKLGDNFFTKVYSTFNVYDNTENKSVSSIIEGTSDADKYEITFGVSGISTSEIESINLYKSYKGKKTDIIKPANQNQVEIVGIEGQPDRIKAVIQKEKDMVGVHCMIIKLKSGYMYRVPTLICFDLPVTSNLKHDVNLDGKISSSDALLVRKHLDGTRTLDKEALGRADANEDGKVDMTDAQLLLSWSIRN